MTESWDDRLWRRSQEDTDRLSMVGSCLGSLEHLLRYPDAEDREARLAAVATDLRVALFGDEVARAEVEAYLDEVIRRLTAPPADVPHRRGCVLAADHRGECRTGGGDGRG